MNCVKATQPQPQNAWLFDICKLTDSLAVSTSSNHILLFDAESLNTKHSIHKAHDGIISGLVSAANDANALYSSSRDGTVKCWDLRTPSRPTRTYRSFDNGSAGILSIAHHAASDKFAMGTELRGTDAVVSVHDARAGPDRALATYRDSHGDDITSLSWHPSTHLLLSGGGDGIVNVLDTQLVDEEDAVLQVLNHGSSVHLAHFVGKNEVLVMSHMETAALYKLSYNQEDVPRDEVREFGDVRGSLSMDYAISFDATTGTLFTGANEGRISMIPFDVGNTMAFETAGRVDVESGTTEIVRSVHLDRAPNALAGPVLYAASEDGVLRVYSKDGGRSDEDRVARKRERRESKSARKKDALRFEPY